LRKFLIAGALVALSLVVAAVAFAQNPAPTASMEVTVNPEKAGTKKKPKNVRLELEAISGSESKATASQLDILIPKSLKIDAKGLKKCSLAKLNDDNRGPDSCPTKSRAGSGEADALLNPNATAPAPIHFVVRVYVGGKKKKKSLLNFYLDSDAPAVHQAIPGVVTRIKNDPIYGQKLKVSIADNLQQPAPGVYSALQRLETSLSLKYKKRKLVKSVRCPASNEHQIGLVIHYVPNPNPPAAESAEAIDGAPCT
jgi:hypothetical protein